MPSKEQKNNETEQTNVVEFKPSRAKGNKLNNGTEKQGKTAKEKKNPITLTKIATFIILGLLAIVLVIGIFPALNFGQSGADSIVFGKYDGIPVEFKNGNYFQRQYTTLSRQTNDTSMNGMYQVWYGAYQNTVFHTALTKLAQEAGIVVADDTLNQAIIDSGAYDKDGKFDPETYKNATVEYQKQVRVDVEENLPASMVVDDISTVLTPAGEVEYIVQMSNNARTFEYVVFDESLYPDDLTASYAQANLSLFTLIDISMITMADEEALKTIAQEIESGATTFADAAMANSTDTFATEGGRAGVYYLYELQDNFTEPEQVNVLFSTKEKAISQVFASPMGYTLYKVESSPWPADLTDLEVLADVKAYIGQHDPGVLTAFLEEQAQLFVQSAQNKDFAIAAGEMNLESVAVSATPANVGESQYLASFSYTDYNGALASLSADDAAMRQLYSEAVGTVTGPFSVGSGFVVAKITGEEAGDEQMVEYLEMVYPFYAQSHAQQDLAMAVFASDKLEDNFFEVFFDQILGYGSDT